MQNARSFIRWSTVAFSVILALAWAPAALAAAPSIGSLSPAKAVAGSAAFTLTINGANFTSASTSSWGATALATTYVSATELTASVPDSLVASADAICVSVSTDADASSCTTFTINLPPAAILGLSPASAVASGVAHTINPSAPPPAVTSVTPATGSTGGAVLTPPISGTIPSPSASPLTASSSSAPLPSTNSNLSSDSLTTTFVGASTPAFAFSVNPPPTITSLSPTTAVAGGAAFTLTINGTNFTTTSTSSWGVTTLATTYVSATQLTAAVPASLVASAGAMSVTVSNVSGTSAGAAFTTNPPPPTITSLSPTTAVAGGAAFTLTINGTNFTATTTSSWGVTALATTYVSATRLTAAVPASLIAGAGAMSVTVSNVSGTSAGATFTINPPPPTITSLSPTSTVAKSAAFTLTINGTNFLPGARLTVVRWNYTALTTTYVSSTQLTAAVPASLIANPGTASISVVTAGGTSSGVSFTVNPAPPIITVMGMTQVPAGFGAFTLNIYGTNFTSPMVANFGATPLTATLVGGSTLPVSIPASLVATVGTLSVTVTTAGGTSAPVTFTVTPQPPVITSLSPASVAAGSAAFTLTVNGSNFIMRMNTMWGSTWVGANVISSTQLTVTIPASLIATAGTAGVQVYGSGQGWSNSTSITINPAPPVITSLSPSSVTAGGAGFMLTITGKVFTTASTVLWGTTPLDTIYVRANP